MAALHGNTRFKRQFSLPTPEEIIAEWNAFWGNLFGQKPVPAGSTSTPTPVTTSSSSTTDTETSTSTSDVITSATTTETGESTSATDSSTGDASQESSTVIVTQASTDSAAPTPKVTSITPSSITPSSTITSTSTRSPGLGVIPSSTVSESTLPLTTAGATQTGVASSDTKKNIPVVAGGVIGALALISVSVILFLCLRRRYLRRRWNRAMDDDLSFMAPFRETESQSYTAEKFRRGRRERIPSIPPTPTTVCDQQPISDRGGDEQQDDERSRYSQITDERITDRRNSLVPLRPPPVYSAR